MVTGRGCFPVGERGHRWLPESRPAVPSSRHSYVYRAAAALPFTAQAQEWLDVAYAPHLRPEGRRRLFALDAPRCLFC
jgi:hypothetical protein